MTLSPELRALDQQLARENAERRRRPAPRRHVCADCQVEMVEGACLVMAFEGATPVSRTYCGDCRRRREHEDPRLLFDPRPWSVIERERSAA